MRFEPVEGVVMPIDTDPALRAVLDALVADHRERPELVRAGRELDDPMRVAVVGRPGSGRDTLARALRGMLRLSPIGPGDDTADADVFVYVVVGWPRSTDHESLRPLPVDRTVVVLGKGDTLGSWEDACGMATACGRQLHRPVIPLMPLLGCADLSDDEFALLVGMVRREEPMPSMAATFVDGDRDERTMRTGILRRIDQYGALVAMDEIAESLDRGVVPNCDDVLAVLFRESGLQTLADHLNVMRPAVQWRRRRTVVSLLNRMAAAGIDRDRIEDALATAMPTALA